MEKNHRNWLDYQNFLKNSMIVRQQREQEKNNLSRKKKIFVNLLKLKNIFLRMNKYTITN